MARTALHDSCKTGAVATLLVLGARNVGAAAVSPKRAVLSGGFLFHYFRSTDIAKFKSRRFQDQKAMKLPDALPKRKM
jgi:hypothetical protein